MTSRIPSLEELESLLLGGARVEEELGLRLGDCEVCLRCTSALLADHLRRYFRYLDVWSGCGEEPDVVVVVIEKPAERLDLPFRDWARDPGKVGRKEEFADIPGGRVIHKVRTGMQFLVGGPVSIAFGPALANKNQVVNFANALYMSWMLERGYSICHASAVTSGSRGLALAGTSGGGKSTLALHLLGRGLHFVSNDRLLVRREGGRTRMTGVAKLPRVNPGTILGNENLRGMLAEDRRAELAELPRARLWNLEEKHDVELERFPGTRFELLCDLHGFVVLNWRRDSTRPTRASRVDLGERPELLAAIMKSPGPFYLPRDGSRPQGQVAPDRGEYLRQLGALEVFELSGRVDFDLALDLCLSMLAGSDAA